MTLCLLVRTTEELFLMFGGAIGYWRGSHANLVDDIVALRPTMFVGVPRVFDAMYDITMANVNNSNVFKKILFDMAYNRKKNRIERGVPSAKVGADRYLLHTQ